MGPKLRLLGIAALLGSLTAFIGSSADMSPTTGSAAGAQSFEALEAYQPDSTTGNMLGNPGFESDWINHVREHDIISGWPENNLNQSDGIPDVWEITGNSVWDGSTSHSGRRSLRFDGSGSVAQTQLYASYSGPLDTSYGVAGRERPRAAIKTNFPDRFYRPITISAWCKGEDVPAESPPNLSVQFGPVKKSVPFSAGTHDWELQQVTISPEELREATEIPMDLVVSLNYPASTGKVWFDDASFVEDLPASPNLAPNSSFEDVDPDTDRPRGWSDQKKYLWIPYPYYYVWRNWHHFFQENRGPVEADSLIARTGSRSFKFSVFPGDEKYVESDPIVLNQTESRTIEVGIWAKTDNIRYLDLRCYNQDGNPLADADFIIRGFTPWGIAGTHGWRYIRKFFASPVPVKEIRVHLCARGFNGNTSDDVGQRTTVMPVGTVWFDDLRVIEPESTTEELVSRRVSIPEAVAYANPPLQIVDLDLGERLWGENELRFLVRNSSSEPIGATLELYTDPPASGSEQRREEALFTEAVLGQYGPDQSRWEALDYRITGLARGWQEQGQIALVLRVGGKMVAIERYFFGTWPSILKFEVEKSYLFPEENPLNTWMNIGVARQTLGKVQSLVYEVRKRRDDSLVSSVNVPDFPTVRAGFETPKIPEGYTINGFNLLFQKIDVSELPIHEQTDPVRDHYILLKALDVGGDVVFQEKGPFFGRMEPHNEVLEPIKSVEVRDHALWVNGKGFYGRGATLNYPIGPSPNNRDRFSEGDNYKRYGFNVSAWFPRPGTLQPLEDMWKKNTYVCDYDPTTPEQAKEVADHPGLLSFALVNSGIENTASGNLANQAQREALLAQIRQFTNKPIYLQDTAQNWFNYGLGATKVFDIISTEDGWYGPNQARVQHFPYRPEGTGVHWDSPNTWTEAPFEMVRFEIYEGMIRGQTGYQTVANCGDVSLYRGLNGEIRHIEPVLFSGEQPAQVTVEPNVSHIVRQYNGSTYIIATNSQPTSGGKWEWNTDLKFSGSASHRGDAWKKQIYPDWSNGYTIHSYKDDQPIAVSGGDKLVQYVYGDPKKPPKTIMLILRGNGDWNHVAYWGDFDHAQFRKEGSDYWFACELYIFLWDLVGWTADPQDATRLEMLDKYVFRAQDFHRMGDVPKPGQWAKLEVDLSSLGMEGKLLDGVAFVTRYGDAWWDHTAFLRQGQETVLCEDSVGIPDEALKNVTFSVPGLADGTPVEALFEERTLYAKDGKFSDDLQGEAVGYDLLSQGVSGDKSAPDVYMAGGYMYNYPNVAVHIYRIPLAPGPQASAAVHPPGWMEKHGAEGKDFANACSSCHQKKECDECHGLEMPHPQFWFVKHFPEASWERDGVCLRRCHKGEKPCGPCHA